VVMSAPKLTVVEGDKGEIFVGSEIPIPILQHVSRSKDPNAVTTQTFQFGQAEVGIRISPICRVVEEDRIELTVEIEQSQVVGEEEIRSGQTTVLRDGQPLKKPIINRRAASMTVKVEDGGGIVLSDVFAQGEENSEKSGMLILQVSQVVETD